MKRINSLNDMARICRGDVLKMTSLANSGHPGGPLSSMEMFVAVLNYANLDPKNPWDENRDRTVISHGHTSAGVYSVLGRMGFFDIDEAISGFRISGSIFEGHVTRGIPGVEWTTGNLGQGLSTGVGFALAAKLMGKSYHTYVLMGDAEQAKGQVAEARRTARKYSLSNLTVLIDYNNAQISGRASDVMPVNIKDEYLADGWNVYEIDGHDIEQINNALDMAKEDKLTPTMILCNTQMGHGVSFMVNEVSFHGSPLKPEQLEKALKELKLENDMEKYAEMRKKYAGKKHEKIYLEFKPEIDTGKPIIYDVDKKVDNRSALGNAIKDLGITNPDSSTPVIVVDCDLKSSVKTDGFANACPENFVQLGVAEHNAAAMSGAMSVCNTVTFFGDFGMFGIDETYNQQRLNDINHTNLKLVTTHVGTDTGEDGKTHHCIDYVGAMANFYNFKTIVPADPNQTDKATRFSASVFGNYLIAMGRSKLSPLTKTDGTVFFDENYEFIYGKIDELRNCDEADTVIVSMGATTEQALKATDEALKTNRKVGLLNVSCPLELKNNSEFLELKLKDKKVITVEDHNVNTGLGAQLSSAILENGIPIKKIIKLGIAEYAVSSDKNSLFSLYGIDSANILKNID